MSDDWRRTEDSDDGNLCSSSSPWTGKTIFLVDKRHDDRWGTDQRRQRDELANARGGRAAALGPRPRWADISDSE